MKEIKRYEVEGYEFTDAEFAAKVEPILKAYPELEFKANGNELQLPFGDDAKIYMYDRELAIQVVDYNPTMSSHKARNSLGSVPRCTIFHTQGTIQQRP